MKYLVFILLLISSVGYGQTTYYIRADSTRLQKVGGNNELIIENSTRARTGAYLKNTWNGRTGFFYAVDSAYISGSNLVLVRGGGTQDITVPVGGGGTVTSVSGLSPLFTVANATTTPTFSLISQSANRFFASPDGAPGVGSFRALVAGDLPDLNTVAWKLTGNSGTNTTTNFIGTTDNIDFVTKLNNIGSGWLSITGQTSLGYSSILYRSSNAVFNRNTAIGYFALSNNRVITPNEPDPPDTTYAQDNTAIGYQAMENIDAGTNNVAVGYNALREGGDDNVAIGYNALSAGNAGSNVAIGKDALSAGGSSSVAIGKSALKNNTTSNNISIGNNSLILNTTGTENIAIGISSLSTNITSSNNIAIGSGALAAHITGQFNTAIGESAMARDTNSNYNTSVGYFSMNFNKSGSVNAAFGANALLLNTTGEKNTAIGAGAMENNTTGLNNTGIGQDVGLNNTTGYFNTWSGWNAKTGSKGIANVAIGYQAGASLGDTSSYNTFVGFQAGSNASQEDTVYNSIAIGNGTFTTASNQVVIGNSSITQTKLRGMLYFDGATGTGLQSIRVNAGATGMEYYTPSTVATAVPISGLTAATAGNSIDNGDFSQIWEWDALTGIGLRLQSSATTAASNTQVLLYGQLSGVNANSNQTTITGQFQNVHTGTGSINIAGEFRATSGASNYAIIVPASSGSVGIGNSAPAALFSVGSASQFQVTAAGVVTGVLTNATGLPPVTGIVGWPANASGQLTNDGSGGLSWSAGGGGWGTTGTVSTLTGASTLAMGTNTFNFSNGSVGIKTTPGLSFHVDDQTGAAQMRLSYGANVSDFRQISGGGLRISSGNGAIQFLDGVNSYSVTLTNAAVSQGIVLDATGMTINTYAGTGAMSFLDNSAAYGFFGASGDASAKLAVTSTTKGFLPPRMTTTEKNAISSPAEGLIVYDLTLHKLCVYTGSAWETITSL